LLILHLLLRFIVSIHAPLQLHRLQQQGTGLKTARMPSLCAIYTL
jgi:hypothetical protein